MSRFEVTMGRFAAKAGLAALLLASAGCIQRGAPVEIPGASPPPRAVLRAPAPGYQVPPPLPQRRVGPVYGGPATPFPQIGTSTLPPPNTNPVVADVGTPLPRTRPTFPPLQRSRTIEEEPLDFGSIDAPSPDTDSVRPRRDVTYTPPARRSAEETQRPRAPRASDDYATLLGGGNRTDTDADGSGDTSSAQTPPAGGGANGPQALVALLVPESDQRGSVRALADGLAKAASLAASDFNEPRLVLRKYDTGGDPRKAAEAAKNAIADGARLIIGPLFSGSAAAVRPIAQSANVQVVAFTTDESVLGGGLYSIGFLPQTEINRIVSYAASRNRKSIAILAPNTPYGNVITREAKGAAARAGAKIVRTQPFNPDFRAMDVTATDFAKYYEGAPNVDGLLMATNGRTLGALSAYLAYRDVLPTKVKYLGLGLWDDKETFREATLRGGWFPGVDPALKSDFNYRYSRAYGGDAPTIAFLGYDAVAVAAALLKTGVRDPFSRQAILSPSGFTGMSGLFRFRPDGRNDRALSILEVGQQQFKVVDPAPTDFSSLFGG